MLKLKNITFNQQLMLILFCLIALKLLSLGLYPLMDMTEARYAEISRKMLETKEYIVPYFTYEQPFWGKPPLTFWASAWSMNIFGINEFGARVAPFIAGLLALFLLFFWHFDARIKLSTQVVRKKPQETVQEVVQQNVYTNNCLISNSSGYSNYTFCLAAIIIFLSTEIGFVSIAAVMTDMYMLLGINLSMISFYRNLGAYNLTDSANRFNRHKSIWNWLFFIGLSVGLLAKGPIAVILVGISLFLWSLLKSKFKQVWFAFSWGYGFILVLILVLPWYIVAEISSPGFLNYFIYGEHFARFLQKGWQGDLYGKPNANPLGMIWLHLFLGALPWSLLALFICLKKYKIVFLNIFSDKNLYLLCWLLSPILFFTFSKNILITYVLPGLPAFALLLSQAILGLQHFRPEFKKIWLIPWIEILLVLILFYPASFIFDNYSHKKFLTAWDHNSTLIYFKHNVFSAEFYSQGKVKIVRSAEKLKDLIQGKDIISGAVGVKKTIAIREKYLDLPELRQLKKWQILAKHKDWLLLAD